MSHPSPAALEAARTLVARLKKQWRKERAPDAPAALAAHPELADHPSLVVDLAYEDYLLREQAGDAPSPASFAALFPDVQSVVHSVIAEHRRLTDENPDLVGGDADADWPPPGETVGRVRLVSVLGGGGFARAYLAYDPNTDRLCVLKLTAGPSAEAQVIGKLDHPHVTGVYWADEVAGRTAVCMPLVGANTLADVVAVAFPPDGPAADRADVILTVAGADDAADAADVEVVRAGEPYLVGAAAVAGKLAGAVAYLHRQGVAHGDLKPMNAVIGRGGSPLLIDFNLSTRAGGPVAVRGTPGYLAPELLEAPDPLATTADLKRADLFALGVLVTELLTGRRPFPAADPTSFAAQAVAARTPPVIAAAVPPAVAAVLRACLSPDPAARPASAAVLAAELEKVVAAARTPAPRRWRRAAAAVAGVAAVAVVAVLAVALVLPQPTRAERPPVTAEEYFYRGWLAMKAEDWAGARSDFVTSDRLASNRWALALAAYCATSGGKHDEAIGLARWLDKETPGGAPPDVLNVLGHAYVQLSRHAEALPPLDRALLRESLPAAHYNRALARNRLRENPAGAADDMRVALAGLRPASFELHADAARAFAAASDDAPGLRAEALAHVRAALALGVRPEPLRGESAFRPRFRSGFGSGLAFEAALAAPRGPAPGKLPRLRLVEPVPF